MTKFVLGPIQEAWLKSLEAHPERQTKSRLGLGDLENYKACCLGEALIILCIIKKKEIPFNEKKQLYDGISPVSKGQAIGILENSYKELGLFSSSGIIKGEIRLKGHFTLATANDSGISWKEIAKFIRKNPESVFNESK